MFLVIKIFFIGKYLFISEIFEPTIFILHHQDNLITPSP